MNFESLNLSNVSAAKLGNGAKKGMGGFRPMGLSVQITDGGREKGDSKYDENIDFKLFISNPNIYGLMDD